MKLYFAAFTAIFTISSTCVGGGFDPGHVPSSVKWVFHVDVDQARATQVGEYLLGEMSKGQADRKLSALATVLRFDPRTDMKSVTLFGQNDTPESAAVVIHGAFDAQALETMIKGNDEYRGSTHNGQTIHSWVDKGQRSFGAVNGETVVISQGKALVAQVLDVVAGNKASLDAGSPISPSNEPGVIASMGADMRAMQNLDADAAMLKKAKFVRGSISEGNRHITAALSVTATDGQTAEQLFSMVQGMIAFAQLNAEESPELTQLANSMKVARDGDAISMAMLLPIADIMEMLEDNQAWKNEF